METVVTTDQVQSKGRLRDKFIAVLGRILLGSLVLSGVTGGGIKLYELNSSGQIDSTPTTIAVLDVYNFRFSSSGGSANSNTAYDSFCKPIPFSTFSTTTSGVIMRASYFNKANPQGNSVDIGFVEDCVLGSGTGAENLTARGFSGSDLFNTTCSSTGCSSFYTTGTLGWPALSGSNAFLKATISGDAGASFDARLRIQLEETYE